MENSRFSNKIKSKTSASGISEQLPQVLKYPQLLGFSHHGEVIRNIFSYIMPHYGHDGLAVLIYRQPKNDNVIIICGDWNGNKIDITGSEQSEIMGFASDFLMGDAIKFCELMKVISVEQAQFYFAIDEFGLCLVDVQLSLNKWASPGMLREVFGKLYRTPETRKIEVLDDRAMEYIDRGTGSYEGNLVIKPSRFRMFHQQESKTYTPMYVEVIR